LLPPLSFLGSPRTLGSSISGRLRPVFTKQNLASPALPLHHSVSHSKSPPIYLQPRDRPSRVRKAPCLSSPALQHFRIQEPFFSLLRSKKRLSGLPSHSEGSHAGFGYPLCELIVQRPSEASFSSQRSWASPFRAFLLPGDRFNRYRSNLPLLRFPAKPPGLAPTLQRVHPIEKAAPLIATRGFSPGRGLLLSWDFRVSQALPPEETPEKSSPLPGSPRVLPIPKPLNSRTSEPQGFQVSTGSASPPKGRRPA